MKDKQYNFNYENIKLMIKDYRNLTEGNLELRDYVFKFIDDCIQHSLHNLTMEETCELLEDLNNN